MKKAIYNGRNYLDTSSETVILEPIKSMFINNDYDIIDIPCLQCWILDTILNI